jgi:deoxycytidine triphosphate deaminase
LAKILSSEEVYSKGFVKPDNRDPNRTNPPTTVNAKVGEIVDPKGKVLGASSYRLPPRGIAWLVSSERVEMPDNMTGLSTLRTTWTRKGILTLTVGIVDPGYHGYLSTAVINFGRRPFTINKGDEFLRTIFFDHDLVEAISRVEQTDAYLNSVIADTDSFSDTFLTIDSLAVDIRNRIFGLPSLAIQLGIIGVILALLALALVPAYDTYFHNSNQTERIIVLEQKLKALEEGSN